jgi:hypothetical protein
MSALGHSRPGRAGRRSSHVRYAPKATFSHQNAIGRDGPTAEVVYACRLSYGNYGSQRYIALLRGSSSPISFCRERTPPAFVLLRS